VKVHREEMRACARPRCEQTFTWSTLQPRRKYCSRGCKNLGQMAAYRAREGYPVDVRPESIACSVCKKRIKVPVKGNYSKECVACRPAAKAARRHAEYLLRKAKAATAKRMPPPPPSSKPPRPTATRKRGVVTLPCASCRWGEPNTAAEFGWACGIVRATSCGPLGPALLWTAKAKEARA